MPQNSFPWTGAEAPTFDEIRDKPATYAPPAATGTVIGGVKAAAKQPAAAGANPTKAEYDGLIAALVASGAMLPA